MLYKFEYPMVLYPINLVVTIGDDFSTIYKNYNNMNDEPITDLDGISSASAFTFACKSKKTKKIKIVICFVTPEVMTYSVVAHESVHAAKEMFDYINADINPHEPFEYLVGYIAKCCDNSLKNMKKSKQH
jgi:hypothetical protein